MSLLTRNLLGSASVTAPLMRMAAVPLLRHATPSRSMATTQQLKIRLKSVGNIGKITKAMKMVAASKLRAVEQLLDGARAFEKTIVPSWPEAVPEKPLPSLMVVALTSDRGLCGAVNSSIVKSARALADVAVDEDRDVKFFILGDKGKAGLERDFRESFTVCISEFGKSKPATFSEISLVAEHLLAQEFDEMALIYNKFKSAISYDTKVERGLSLFEQSKDEKVWEKYSFEGEQREILQSLHEYRTAARLYHMIVEGATSEQSSRMSAMDSSSKNAGEMFDALELQYNRKRQATITTELIEIISGATAAEESSGK